MIWFIRKLILESALLRAEERYHHYLCGPYDIAIANDLKRAYYDAEQALCRHVSSHRKNFV